MANLAAIGTGGNFTTAGTWGVCSAGANAALNSEVGSTALTTSDQSSATFTPAATAIDAIYVKLASRATGSPSNTLTLTLRNNTTATDVASVVINVSDLPACTTTDRCGGWIAAKFNATHTPNGTDTYVIKAKLSATTTAVSLWRDGTVANWSRLVRTTTTGAPAAGDVLFLAGEYSNATSPAATPSAQTVTMNETATTQYGAGGDLTLESTGAVNVSKFATLAYGSTASTNYVLRLSGHLVVFSGGTFTMGTSGTPIPRSGSAVLEFVVTSDGDSGLCALNGATVTTYGQSRTSGKDVVYTTLSAAASSGDSTFNVTSDTGWLSGDEVGMAPTSRTRTDIQQFALNANAGASSIVATTTLTVGRDVDTDVTAEIGLLTRNVKVRSTSSATRTFVYAAATANVDLHWTEFRYLGFSTADRRGILVLTTAGNTFTLDYCSLRDFNQGCVVAETTATGTVVWTNNVSYRSAGSGIPFDMQHVSSAAWTITGNIICGNASGVGMNVANLAGTLTNNRIAACTTAGLQVAQAAGTAFGTFSGNVVHGGSGVTLDADLENCTLGALTVWRCSGAGVTVTLGATLTWRRVVVESWKLFGNTTTNLSIAGTSGHMLGVTWRGCVLAGDTSFSTTNGVASSIANAVREVVWENAVFGGSGATKTTHTNDVNLTGACLDRWVFRDCSLLSGTEVTATSALIGSYFAHARKDGSAASHQTTFSKRGVIALDTGTTHDASPSQKLTPATTGTYKLESGPKRAAVASGDTLTFTVYVRKDGSYVGAAPRLMLRANPAAGIDADVVLDTLSVAANTWEQLTGTSAAVTDNAVLEVYVDCDGAAGNVFVDDWEAA